MSAVPAFEHGRIESLGDNCELGFVLRRLGNEAGSLFRWAAMSPSQLLAMLRDGLEGFYQLANLKPLRPSMIRDAAYGIGWHSELRCRDEGGAMVFVAPPEERERIHAREMRKLRYLVAKFRARLRLGGVVFVVKCNDGIPPGVLVQLHEALRAEAQGTPVTLLEVKVPDDPALVGTVHEQAPGLLSGYVPKLALYSAADTGEFKAWCDVLAGALAMAPCPDWAQRQRRFVVDYDDGAVTLPFPAPRGADWSKPVMGDLRGGAVRLLGGNEWCRVVPEGFRLHGPDPAQAPAQLCWANVFAAGPRVLSASLRCPVEDSLPVELVIEVSDANRTPVGRQALRVTPDKAGELFVPVLKAAWPLDIRIAARAGAPVPAGARAVVDLSDVALFPHEEAGQGAGQQAKAA